MRLVAVLAGAVLIAGLSLVAAPGSAGSRTPSRPSGVDPALLQPLLARGLSASSDALVRAERVRETARASVGSPVARDSWSVVADGRIDEAPDVSGARATSAVGSLAEGAPLRGTPTRPVVRLPAPVEHKSALLRGIASWYDNGTTAMRLPKGSHVRICGPATCVNRVVSDWGPDARIYPERVVDLMPADFARICGCSARIGLTYVSVELID